MFDITRETPIPFREIPAWWEQRFGHRPHPSTCHRWRIRGIRRVRLSTFLAAGTRYSSLEELERFVAATTVAADGEPVAEISRIDANNHAKDEAYLDAEGL